MKIGDLVKFRDEVAGMGDMRGVIVAFNGCMPIVGWASSNYRHPVTEVSDFLEVISNKEKGSAV